MKDGKYFFCAFFVHRGISTRKILYIPKVMERVFLVTATAKVLVHVLTY
jgi:hypothetical protein